MAKSFLLWSDIFTDKGDDFQAIQTLQSLIDYYEKPDDGILDAAKAKRKLLADRQEKANTPAVQEEMEINMEEWGGNWFGVWILTHNSWEFNNKSLHFEITIILV